MCLKDSRQEPQELSYRSTPSRYSSSLLFIGTLALRYSTRHYLRNSSVSFRLNFLLLCEAKCVPHKFQFKHVFLVFGADLALERLNSQFLKCCRVLYVLRCTVPLRRNRRFSIRRYVVCLCPLCSVTTNRRDVA